MELTKEEIIEKWEYELQESEDYLVAAEENENDYGIDKYSAEIPVIKRFIKDLRKLNKNNVPKAKEKKCSRHYANYLYCPYEYSSCRKCPHWK